MSDTIDVVITLVVVLGLPVLGAWLFMAFREAAAGDDNDASS